MRIDVAISDQILSDLNSCRGPEVDGRRQERPHRWPKNIEREREAEVGRKDDGVQSVERERE